MAITSFYYLAFVAVGTLVYYIFPKKIQWLVLFAMSIAFYCMAATPYTIVFPIAAVLLAYLATNIQQSEKIKKSRFKYVGLTFVSMAVVCCLGLWFWLKASDIWISLSYRLGLVLPFVHTLEKPTIIAALGMGYYTLQIVGYILDCYWGSIKPQRNPLKLFLFVTFFPQMITGPISRYQQLEALYEKHTFSYENLTRGAQRILWGFVKRLVLAERAGIIVNGIYGDLAAYTGWWHWVALLLYPIQMYADFSGCMDIVLGTAEIFDIKMPENFRNPFFAKSSQEFWQRWHITLGAWAKDYVLYPILKMKWLVKLGKKGKKVFGKKAGKFIPTFIGMFFLWMVMGIWHGSLKYIVGVSLWYWAILMLGEIFAPVFNKIADKLEIRTECFSWKFFQCARTYLIYAIGAVFFRTNGISEGIHFVKSLFGMFVQKGQNNPWVLFDGSVLSFGIVHADINIMIISVVLLLIVAILREKHGYARDWMAKQNLVFRWIVWIGLFVFVVIFGKYGPGYNAADFIYQGF